MTFGLSDSEFQLILRILEKNLSSRPDAAVYVFGSRARGQFKPYSDIDLLIEAKPPLSSSEMTLLRAELEESATPFKIDLVQAQDLPETYLPGISADRKSIKAKSSP